MSKKSAPPPSLPTPKPFIAKPISLKTINLDSISRADLQFDGVDHAGASFAAYIFFDNPNATAATPRSIESGYAGKFNIFGHGGCLGDPGHCEVRGLPRMFDPRPAHPLTPARKVVIVTAALRYAIAKRKSKSIVVRVVPVVTSGTKRCDFENVLKLDSVTLQVYC